MKSRTIGWKEFTSGMSTSADIQDAGFSPETDAVNLIAQPGVLNPVAQPVDASTNVSGNFIADCEDYATVAANNRFFVDDAANYYSWNGTTITKQKTDSSGNSYVDGKTGIIPFALGFLTTTTTDITLWNGTATLNTNYWTTTLAQAPLNANVPHPILQFQKIAWIGDGNLLHKIDESGAATNGFLTLAATDTITALAVEPGSGYMLIAVTSGQNLSDTLNRTAKIHYFDGTSNKPTKTVIVEDQVTSFLVNGGTIYAFYGQNFGYFTGSGLHFIRKTNVALSNVTSGSSSGLIWEHRACAIGTTIYYIEGGTVTAYGEIRQGSGKVFYPAYKNVTNTNAFTLLCNLGSNKLGISLATTKFFTFDVTSIGSNNTMDFFTDKIEFPGPTWVRQVWVFYKTGVSNNADPGSLRLRSESGIISDLGNSGILDLKNTSGSTEYVHKFLGLDQRVNTLQLEIIHDTVICGFRKFVVFYDDAEII